VELLETDLSTDDALHDIGSVKTVHAVGSKHASL